MLNLRLSALVATVFLFAGGCKSSSGNKDGGTGGVDGAIPGQGGTNFTCGVEGDTCATGANCCTNLCDTVTKKCLPGVTSCSGEGSSCKVSTDCCNMKCDTATLKCKTGTCIADNQTCTDSADCCGQSCVGGVCKPLNNVCLTAGNPCEVTAAVDGSNNNCCSGLCAGGKCVLGSSFCIQPGDACSRNTDCCGGWCSKASASDILGVCQNIDTTSAGNCKHDGELCGDECGECCSRSCAPWALTGVHVCQPGLGCKILNSLCVDTKQCCGGDTGDVTCVPSTTSGVSVGVCRQNTSNQVIGGVCGGWQNNDGVVDSTSSCSNAEHDCTCAVTPKWKCCHLDSLGVPRCMGSGTCGVFSGADPNCCIPAGEKCSMSNECCNFTPCVPDDQGVLRCMPPKDGGPTCVEQGETCTATADCCTGLVCNLVPGQEFGAGTCGPPVVYPPGDGGTPVDAGVPACALYGQTCTDTIKCCNNVPCTNPLTNSACGTGVKGCSCFSVNPIP